MSIGNMTSAESMTTCPQLQAPRTGSVLQQKGHQPKLRQKVSHSPVFLCKAWHLLCGSKKRNLRRGSSLPRCISHSLTDKQLSDSGHLLFTLHRLRGSRDGLYYQFLWAYSKYVPTTDTALGSWHAEGLIPLGHASAHTGTHPQMHSTWERSFNTANPRLIYSPRLASGSQTWNCAANSTQEQAVLSSCFCKKV